MGNHPKPGRRPPKECDGETCITCGKELAGVGKTWDHVSHTATLYTFTPLGAEPYFRKKGQDYYQCERCYHDPYWQEKQDRFNQIVRHNIVQTESLHRLKLASTEPQEGDTDSRHSWTRFIQDSGNMLNKEAVSDLLRGLCKYPDLFSMLSLDQIDSFRNSLGDLLVVWGYGGTLDIPIEVFQWIHVFLVEQYFDYNQFDLSAAERACIQDVLAPMLDAVVNVREMIEVTTYAYQIMNTQPILEEDECLCTADNVAAGFIHLLLSEAGDKAASQSEWPQAACMALVNTLIKQPQQNKYDYRRALGKLVYGKTWSPMEVAQLLLSLQPYIESENLPEALEQVISLRLGFRSGPNGMSITDVMKSQGPLGIFKILYEETREGKNFDKDIGTLCNEMAKDEWAAENDLNRAKNIVLSVLQKLKKCGYPNGKLKIDHDKFEDMNHDGNVTSDDVTLSSVLAHICCLVKQTKGYWPRATQILSCILLSISDKTKGRLIEIATGEGKSCIIAMHAVVLALSGKYVDIVTSSPVLAERDCNHWKEFYKLCELTVSHNGSTANDSDRQKCYQSNVVYGTVGSFASDILRQEFYLRQIRGSRDMERSAVIADEVDFMLLDRGVQFTYLSDRSLGLHHLEPIIATIWGIVSRFRPVQIGREEHFLDKPQPFHKALESIIGVNNGVTIEKIREIARSGGILEKFPKAINADDWLLNISSGEMVKFFRAARSALQIDFKIYEMQAVEGKYVPVNVTTSNEDDTHGNFPMSVLILEKGLCSVLCKDEYTLQVGISNTVKHYTSPKSDQHINVPIHLQDLVEHMIPVWVESAFQATRMTKDREYHIKDGKVLPVDFGSTGVIETNKKWGDGLQQFVELKHHLQFSEISLVTNYMSNLAFFKKYESRLFGVTGTLGSETDKEFLLSQFHVDICHVPTHKRRKLHEEPGRILHNKAEWLTAISEEVVLEVKNVKWRKGARAALVICEDIISAEEVAYELNGKVPGEMHIYTGKDKNTSNVPELSPGDVMVATNLAGRGTDIKVTDEVNMAGGLLVIVSFLPSNTRVEMQAFGRTGREGQPGSAKLLLNDERLGQVYRENAQSVQGLKMIRELLAKDRLDIMMKTEAVVCSIKEELLNEYCSRLKLVIESFNDMGDKDKELALMFLHDQWGMWLRMKSDEIRGMVCNAFSSLPNEIESLNSSLARLINDTVQSIKKKDSNNMYYIIRCGNNFLRDGKYEQAVQLYDKVVQMDASWASIALYNRAYCNIKLKDAQYKNSAISDLAQCLEKLANYKEEIQITITNTHCFSVRKDSKESTDDKSDLQKYLEMKQHVLLSFEKNVQEAKSMLESLTTNQYAEADLEPIIPAVHVDELEKHELMDLGFRGLMWFFSVAKIKKKNHFCWSGLLAAFIGVVQVAAGIFLSAVSVGTLAEIGGALVVEGCSDIYAGMKGMYKGEFDWKSWAVGKAMSIVITVVTFGVGTYINAGSKALAGAVEEMGPSLEEIPSLVRSQFGKEALEKAVKIACKDAGAQFAEQGVQEVVNAAVDTSVNSLMATIENEAMVSVKKHIKEDAVSGKISKSIDFVTGTMLPERPVLSDNMCYQLRKQFKLTAKDITFAYIASPEWQSYVQQLASGIADGVLQRHPENKTVSIVEKAIRLLNLGHGLIESEKRTKELLEKFKSELDSYLHKEFGKVAVKNRDIFSDIAKESEQMKKKYIRLKDDIGDDLATILSTAIQEIWRKFFVGNVTAEISKTLNKHIAEKTGSLLGRHQLRESLEAGVTALHTASMSLDHVKSTIPVEDIVEKYKLTLSQGDEMASVMDVRILAEKLGKRIEILKGDENGKPLIVVGTNEADDVIKVVYQKPTKDRKYGHYDAVVDGKLIRVENEGNDCLFHAVSLARGESLRNVESDSRHLRHLAARELDENPEKWGHLIARTNQARAISEKLLMVGGTLKKIDVSKAQEGKVMIYKVVGRRTNVEADHIPACSSYVIALRALENAQNPLARQLIKICKYVKKTNTSSEKFDKFNLPCVITEKSEHRYFVTTGNSYESQAVRHYIANTIKKNQPEEMLKASMLGSSVHFTKSVDDLKPADIRKTVPEDSGTDKIKRNVDLLNVWRTLLGPSVLSEEQYKNLVKWVQMEQFKSIFDPTRKKMLEECKRALKNKRL